MATNAEIRDQTATAILFISTKKAETYTVEGTTYKFADLAKLQELHRYFSQLAVNDTAAAAGILPIGITQLKTGDAK